MYLKKLYFIYIYIYLFFLNMTCRKLNLLQRFINNLANWYHYLLFSFHARYIVFRRKIFYRIVNHFVVYFGY